MQILQALILLGFRDVVDIVESVEIFFAQHKKCKKTGKFGNGNYPHSDKKISTIFLRSYSQKSCGYCGKLFANQIFTDFYNISGTHSYQQIAVDTIF